MEKTDKINILNNRISNMSYHIEVLSKDILDNPEMDTPGKPARTVILEQFKERKMFLENELLTLTNQG